MLKEAEQRQESDWERVRSRARALWEKRGEKRLPFGHHDELAERVVFEAARFIVRNSDDEQQARDRLRKELQRANYSEIISEGETLYRAKVLEIDSNAENSLVTSIFNSITSPQLVPQEA